MEYVSIYQTFGNGRNSVDKNGIIHDAQMYCFYGRSGATHDCGKNKVIHILICFKQWGKAVIHELMHIIHRNLSQK